MRTVDLAIVGASFAGLACAKAAAARGAATVVLERKPRVGDRPHTTGIVVKEAADEWDIPRRLTRKLHGVRLYSPSLERLDLASPGYYFLATDTPGVLAWLAREAAGAGAQVRPGSPFTGARREGAGWELPGADLAARYLVGADGARSAVARALGLGRNLEFLVGAEIEFEGVAGLEEDCMHVFLDNRLAPGYIGWVLPGVGITQAGLAARQPRRPDLPGFLEKVSRVFDFSGARRVGQRAGLIPCGGPVRPFAQEGALLLGDAAGMVSPLTAGGIHAALGIGRLAGVALADHLLDGAPEPAAVLRRAMPGFRFKRLLRAGYDLLPQTERAADLLFALPAFRHLAQTIFFHHRGLLSAEAWRDILHLAHR
jgi:flavin-dependent dehydrogenase